MFIIYHCLCLLWLAEQWLVIASLSILNNAISISTVLGTSVVLEFDRIKYNIHHDTYTETQWFKDSTRSISSTFDSTLLAIDNNTSRYRLINRTDLFIERTIIGDEGFYTLKVSTKSHQYKYYVYHVRTFLFSFFFFFDVHYRMTSRIDCCLARLIHT
jgi:hypothetical protein